MSAIGLISSVTLAIFSTAKDTVSKRLSVNISGTLSAFASFLYALPYYLVLLPLLYLMGWETFEVAAGFFGYILLRALSDTGAEWCKLEGITRADLSLVAAFQSMSPAFLIIMSPLLTGDPLTLTSATGLLILAISGALLANPLKLKVSGQLTGVVFGIMSAFFFSINSCFDRLAAQTASATLSAFFMTLIACIFISPFLLVSSRNRGGFKSELSLMTSKNRGLFIRGFFEVGSLVAKLTALQFLTAPTVVAVSRLSVPLSVLTGVFIFKEKQLGRRLLFGSLMVVGSLIALLGAQ